MRAKERIERNVRQIQLLLPVEQAQRLKAYAALRSLTIGDVLLSRIMDIVDPLACEADVHAMAERR